MTPANSLTTATGSVDPDLVIVANVIHTLDAQAGDVEALAVRDGVVVALGSRADARDWATDTTRVVDLGSATVTPGLVDGHLHPSPTRPRRRRRPERLRGPRRGAGGSRHGRADG